MPVPLVSWWRAMIASILVCHSSRRGEVVGRVGAARPAWVDSQPGKPPPSSSALMYGPGAGDDVDAHLVGDRQQPVDVADAAEVVDARLRASGSPSRSRCRRCCSRSPSSSAGCRATDPGSAAGTGGSRPTRRTVRLPSIISEYRSKVTGFGLAVSVAGAVSAGVASARGVAGTAPATSTTTRTVAIDATVLARRDQCGRRAGEAKCIVVDLSSAARRTVALDSSFVRVRGGRSALINPIPAASGPPRSARAIRHTPSTR